MFNWGTGMAQSGKDCLHVRTSSGRSLSSRWRGSGTGGVPEAVCSAGTDSFTGSDGRGLSLGWQERACCQELPSGCHSCAHVHASCYLKSNSIIL